MASCPQSEPRLAAPGTSNYASPASPSKRVGFRPEADIGLMLALLVTILSGHSSFWIALEIPMASERFAYIWQYTIEPTRRSDFLAAYKPRGNWALLFSRDPSYLETVLLQDDEDENRYVTIDYWKSKADRDFFRERFSVEFDSLDSKCEAFTREEQFLGDFLEIGDTSR